MIHISVPKKNKNETREILFCSSVMRDLLIINSNCFNKEYVPIYVTHISVPKKNKNETREILFCSSVMRDPFFSSLKLQQQ